MIHTDDALKEKKKKRWPLGVRRAAVGFAAGRSFRSDFLAPLQATVSKCRRCDLCEEEHDEGEAAETLTPNPTPTTTTTTRRRVSMRQKEPPFRV